MPVEPIRGVIVPILTPFEDDGSIATDLYVAHAKRLFAQGCAVAHHLRHSLGHSPPYPARLIIERPQKPSHNDAGRLHILLGTLWYYMDKLDYPMQQYTWFRAEFSDLAQTYVGGLPV